MLIDEDGVIHLVGFDEWRYNSYGGIGYKHSSEARYWKIKNNELIEVVEPVDGHCPVVDVILGKKDDIHLIITDDDIDTELTYWHNGVVEDYYGDSISGGCLNENGDVILCGTAYDYIFDSIRDDDPSGACVYWDFSEQHLSGKMAEEISSEAMAITCYGNDVYIVGEKGHPGSQVGYWKQENFTGQWKNRKFTPIPDLYGQSKISKIIVLPPAQ